MLVYLRAKDAKTQKGGDKKQVRHQKKPALLSMKYWLFNRDPYNGLL